MSLLGDLLRSNIVNASKHFWKLNDSVFTIFIDDLEANWDGKSLS